MPICTSDTLNVCPVDYTTIAGSGKAGSLKPGHTGIFKGCGYSSRLWLQFLKDVATGKNGRFAREFSGKSTTNAHFTEVMLSMPR